MVIYNSVTVATFRGCSFSSIWHLINHIKIPFSSRFPSWRIWSFQWKHTGNRNSNKPNPTHVRPNRQFSDLAEKAPILLLLSRGSHVHYLQKKFPRQLTQLVFSVLLKQNLQISIVSNKIFLDNALRSFAFSTMNFHNSFAQQSSFAFLITPFSKLFQNKKKTYG